MAGVDDYPGTGKLNSCVSDAKAVQAFLGKEMGVPSANIVLLLDQEATGPAILKALESQCRKAGKNDEVFFYFSGHGTIIPDWEGKGKVTKAMVPYGALPGPVKMENLVSQSALKRALGGANARRVVVMLDCCHAGTWRRSIPGTDDGPKVKFVDVGWAAAEGELAKSESNAVGEFLSKNESINYTWLGACQSNQVSYCGKTLSQFTDQFLKAATQIKTRSLSEFFPQLSQSVEAATKENRSGPQTPQAEGALDMPVLMRSPTITVAPAPQTTPPPLLAAPVTAPAQRPDRQDFPLQITLNQSRFVKDEKMVVQVRAGSDCYLRLYLVNAAAEVQQIFPNEFQKDNFTKAGQSIAVPSAESGFQFTMEGPWGVETIVAVASSEQFSDLVKPTYRDGLFELKNETPGGALRRGIRVERRREPTSNNTTPNTSALSQSGPKVSVAKAQYTVSEKREANAP